MELTPINIRQKRRRKGQPLPATIMVSQDDKANNAKNKKRKKKKRKTAQEVSIARASYFEKEVPLEVLERIFWFSENINLPLSSLRFGWLLSSRSTLRETFIGAFGPTWEKWNAFIALSPEYRSRPLDYPGSDQEGLEWGGNPDFQSALLAQPWADISMILDSEESWRNRFAQDIEFAQARSWNGNEPPNSLSEEEIPTSGQEHSSSSLVRQDFNFNYKIFNQLDASPPKFPKIPKLDQEETYVRVHRDTRIPDDLLTGPWEDDNQVKKLFWLVRAGCLLAEDQTWEVTLQGFRSALGFYNNKNGGGAQDIKLRVIVMLYILGALKHWPQHVLNDVVNDEIPARIEALAHRQSQYTVESRAKYAYVMELLDPLLVTRSAPKTPKRSRTERSERERNGSWLSYQEESGLFT